MEAGGVRDPLLGRVIDGRYTVLRLLGRGGMGAVYRAHQASLDRAVALKVLLGAPEQTREAEFQRRFFLEASTVAKLKHPNTITVFDYGSEEVQGNKIFFIAMEMLEGRTLTQALKTAYTSTDGGGLTLAQTLSVAVQICRSLREAHNAGVVHRDLKPGNIMLVPHDDDPEGDLEFVKVLDFGLAKTFYQEDENLTRVGTFLGSPRYVAPEQIEGRPTDPRADIYALGCVMYRMICGEVPFDGNAPVEIMLKHLNEPPPPLPAETPPLLNRLVMDCLKKDAAERPSSMEEVIGRLKVVRAAVGERVGFMSISEEKLPVVRGRPEPEITKPDRKRLPKVHEVALAEETRPTRNVLTSSTPTKTRTSVFVRGMAAGTVVAVGIVVGLQFGLDGWLQNMLAPADAPTSSGPVIRERLVRLQIRSRPDAQLVELVGDERVMRGRTPLDLDWQVGPGAVGRVFLLEAKGYNATPLAVPIPNDDGTDPQRVELNVKLSRK